MRLSRLILCGLIALTAAAQADAGPIRQAVANWRANHRGGCQAAPAVQQCQPQAAPVATVQQTGTVHQASYVRADGGPVANGGYPAIRLGGGLLPTCGPLGCNR